MAGARGDRRFQRGRFDRAACLARIRRTVCLTGLRVEAGAAIFDMPVRADTTPATNARTSWAALAGSPYFFARSLTEGAFPAARAVIWNGFGAMPHATTIDGGKAEAAGPGLKPGAYD